MQQFFLLPLKYRIGVGIWLLVLLLLLVGAVQLFRRWKRHSRLHYAGKAVLSVWFVAAALTVVEVACALFYDATDSFGTTNVSRMWAYRHVRTNSLGFRDVHPVPASGEDDRYHILFVGDSFTFGNGVAHVADRFSDRVAASLEAAAPGRYSVSNLGLPGIDTRQVVDGLLPKLLRWKTPAQTLVYTFVPNDIEYLDERTADFYQGLAAERPQFFLVRDTYFFNLAYVRLTQTRRPESQRYYDYLAESYESAAWNRLTVKLDQLREACRAHNIDLRIVVFPFLHDRSGDYRFAAAHRKVVDYCGRNGIKALDLQPVFAAHADETLTVSRFDAHPNERAHQLAAEAICRDLLDDLLRGAPESSRR